MIKKPVHLIIYYPDTWTPLTHSERMALYDTASVVAVTPQEVLLKDSKGRMVIVTQAGLPGTPPVPGPRDKSGSASNAAPNDEEKNKIITEKIKLPDKKDDGHVPDDT